MSVILISMTLHMKQLILPVNILIQHPMPPHSKIFMKSLKCPLMFRSFLQNFTNLKI